MKNEWMISGLRKQRDLLAELIKGLEHKSALVDEDGWIYEIVTKTVERNLKQLKKTASHETPVFFEN